MKLSPNSPRVPPGQPGANPAETRLAALTEVTSPDTSAPTPGAFPHATSNTPTQLLPGELLANRFRIIRFIARGGMGEVYEVEDRHLQGVRVALKTIRPEIAADPDAARRFEQEVLLARKVHHPHLCPIYDIARSGDPARPLLFLTMKLLAGETLAARLRRSPALTPAELRIILRQLCDGLAAIHAAGIVHRDLKPGNVMLVAETTGHAHPGPFSGQPTLCISIMDFGLARLHQPGDPALPGQSQDQTVVAGTPGYLAPEMLQGEPPSAATDLYAFGILLQRLLNDGPQSRVSHPYERIVGTEATPAPTARSIRNPFVRENPAPRSNLPASITRPIAGLLALEPARRLEAFARLRTALQKETQPSTRRSLLLGVAIALTAIAVSGGLFALLPGVSQRARGILLASNEKHIAVLPITVASGTPETQAIGDGLMDSLAGKLSNLDTANATLWVIPATELRSRKITTAAQAMKEFGATIVVQGSFTRTGQDTHLELSLVDPQKTRQIGFLDLSEPDGDLPALQDQAVTGMVRLMNIPLKTAAPGASANTPKPVAYEDYLGALGYFQRDDKPGNLDRAISWLQSAVAADPGFSLAYALMTEVYMMKYSLESNRKWLDLAAVSSQKAAELGPRIPEAFVASALYHRATGRADLALQEYQRALDLDPRDVQALHGMATVLQQQARYPEAEQTLLRAAAIHPDDWSGYNALCIFYDEIGRPAQAIPECRRAIDLTPDNSWPWTNLGVAYQDLDDPNLLPQGEQALQRANAIDPTYATWSDLALVYFAEGRVQDALAANLASLKLNNQSADTWSNLAEIYETLHRDADAQSARSEAIALFEQAISVDPQDALALANLAHLYAKTGSTEKARAAIEKSLALSPDDKYVLAEIADACALLDERTEAVGYLNRALAHGYGHWLVRIDPDAKDLIPGPRSKASPKHPTA